MAAIGGPSVVKRAKRAEAAMLFDKHNVPAREKREVRPPGRFAQTTSERQQRPVVRQRQVRAPARRDAVEDNDAESDAAPPAAVEEAQAVAPQIALQQEQRPVARPRRVRATASVGDVDDAAPPVQPVTKKARRTEAERLFSKNNAPADRKRVARPSRRLAALHVLRQRGDDATPPAQEPGPGQVEEAQAVAPLPARRLPVHVPRAPIVRDYYARDVGLQRAFNAISAARDADGDIHAVALAHVGPGGIVPAATLANFLLQEERKFPDCLERYRAQLLSKCAAKLGRPRFTMKTYEKQAFLREAVEQHLTQTQKGKCHLPKTWKLSFAAAAEGKPGVKPLSEFFLAFGFVPLVRAFAPRIVGGLEYPAGPAAPNVVYVDASTGNAIAVDSVVVRLKRGEEKTYWSTSAVISTYDQFGGLVY